MELSTASRIRSSIFISECDQLSLNRAPVYNDGLQPRTGFLAALSRVSLPEDVDDRAR